MDEKSTNKITSDVCFFDDWSFMFFYARIKEEEEVKLGNA